MTEKKCELDIKYPEEVRMEQIYKTAAECLEKNRLVCRQEAFQQHINIVKKRIDVVKIVAFELISDLYDHVGGNHR